MEYGNIKYGEFISRKNRFTAVVKTEGETVEVHVKNMGRCREILVPGARVILETNDSPSRKTKYDLVAAYKGERLFNIDSTAPNKVFGEWVVKSGFFGDISYIKPECTYKKSRFDFYIEADGRKIFVEVKGSTKEIDGVMSFPDAPTERGIKHVNELCDCIFEGYEAYVFFVVQTEGVKYFTPDREIHPEFADALSDARKRGVNVVCVDCKVFENGMEIKNFVDVKL